MSISQSSGMRSAQVAHAAGVASGSRQLEMAANLE
jgi:hypothetical protein